MFAAIVKRLNLNSVTRFQVHEDIKPFVRNTPNSELPTTARFRILRLVFLPRSSDLFGLQYQLTTLQITTDKLAAARSSRVSPSIRHPAFRRLASAIPTTSAIGASAIVR